MVSYQTKQTLEIEVLLDWKISTHTATDILVINFFLQLKKMNWLEPKTSIFLLVT